jgi:tetratricopeptide (TPR) repeat protein
LYKQSVETYSKVINMELDTATKPALKQNLAWAYGGRAKSYAYLKNYTLADKDFASNLKLDTTDYLSTMNSYGRIKAQNQDYDGALAIFNKVIVSDSKNYDAYKNRALAKLMMDDRTGAIADCTTAINIHPDYGSAYVVRAIARNDNKACDDYFKAKSMNEDVSQLDYKCAVKK